MHWVEQRFGRRFCRETVRAALHRLKLSWKKAKKLLGRADPAQRQAFLDELEPLLDGAARDRHLLVYLDEAHIHQDADLGYGWSARGERAWVCSSSPGLSAKRTFYGLYLYNEGQVRLWPYPRGNGEHTIDVLGRLRAEFPERPLIVLWDGVSYHRADACARRRPSWTSSAGRCRATAPTSCRSRRCGAGCARTSPTSTATPALIDLETSVADFQDTINQDPIALADRLALKTQLDPDVEKLRISK